MTIPTHIDQMKESKYLKQGDVEKPVLVTFKDIEEENVGLEDSPQMKWVAHWQEDVKPMVLNTTNIQLASKALGTNPQEWIGKKIVIFADHTIMFKGQVVGGLRLRAPKNQPKQETEKEPAKEKYVPGTDVDPNDDVPW